MLACPLLQVVSWQQNGSPDDILPSLQCMPGSIHLVHIVQGALWLRGTEGNSGCYPDVGLHHLREYSGCRGWNTGLLSISSSVGLERPIGLCCCPQ